MARGARIAEPNEFYDRIPVLLTEQATRIAPLVDPGNPPLSSTSRAKTHSTRRCHGMVALAARSSGRLRHAVVVASSNLELDISLGNGSCVVL